MGGSRIFCALRRSAESDHGCRGSFIGRVAEVPEFRIISRLNRCLLMSIAL